MPQRPDLVPNQFGDAELSTQEAYSACGPAAAVAFARYYGRNPTLKEALEVAKKVGWTAGGGMNGVANQKALDEALGLSVDLETNPNADRIVSEASAGRPVTISTPVHYYVADDYDPQTGQLHVGASGRARKGGGEWMTLQQISQKDGGINGALYLSGDGGPQYQTVSDTTGGGTVAGPQAGSGNPDLDRILAAKGDPVSVKELPNEVDKVIAGQVVGKQPDPQPTMRLTFRDGTYLDVKYGGRTPNQSASDVVGVTGTALKSTATDKPKGEIVGTNASDQWIVRQLPDGTISRTPNPNYVPPKQPTKPAGTVLGGQTANEKNIVIVNPDGTTTTSPNPNYTPPKPTTHVIGGRIYTLDQDGNVVGTADVRTPEERQAQALALQKAQQDLLTKSQLAQQNEAQTIEHIRSMIESGQIEPAQGNAWMGAVRKATAMGTTAFDLAKFEDDAKRAREQMGSSMLNQRLQTAGSLGSSLASSALSAAGHAMFRPGQTSLGVDPLALASQYTQQQVDAAKQDPVIAALLAGVSAPAQPQQPLAAGLK